MKTIVVLYLAGLVVALWVVPVTGGKCNPNCSSDKAGWCQSGGRCLCFWGWTGPNAEYILTGNLKNRIQADHCMVPCHYTHDYRNQSCAASPTQVTTVLPSSTFPIKTQIPRTGNALTTATPCNPNCTIRGHGVCQSDGRCLCWWGWTGPHAVYIQSGSLRNRILADYCFTACHYTHDYRNPACAKIPVPAVCSIPPKPISPPVPCDPQCNAGVYHGQCLSNGRCLCWWGWTGPNSCYVTGNKTLTNRILANSCNVACHYTHDYRNESCVTNKTKVPTTMAGSTHPIMTKIPSTKRTVTTATPCNPNCTIRGHGVCQSDGRCLCWWGWTGPHAVYIQSGSLKNRILADYCFTACHYTHDYRNPACAKIPVPAVCSVPPKPISPPIPCDPQCNAGVYHGQCLTNGRCLCWWGWTGPNSCYVTGNKTLTNRILANSCNVACHYTHDYRNESCVTNKTRSKKPQKPNGPLASAFGAKSALNSEGKTSPEDTNKGASSRPTGSSAAVVVPGVAALILAAFAALILLGYKKKKRQNRVAPQTITYSDSGESEPLLRTFHYNSRT